MRIGKLKRWQILCVAVGVLMVYFVMPFPFLGTRGRDNVRESTIRWLLHHNASGMQDKLQVCFIGVGTSFDPQAGDFGPKDPPNEFLRRFSNFPVPTLPISANTNRFGVADATGKPGLILAAGNVNRWSIGVVACRGFYYEGGLSSAEYEVFLLRLPFTWVPVWSRMLWIS
jgi:hypothetical protein